MTIAACETRPPQPPPEPTYRPTSTLQDIMASIIDPSADALWASVSVIIDSSGTLEKAPKTDAEWAVVRGHAIQLIEASNVIQIPGRSMARTGRKVNGLGAVLLVVMCLTGVVIWWPGSANWRRGLMVRGGTSWIRKRPVR